MPITRQALDSLVDTLPAGVVLTDADGLDKYRLDRALDPAAERPLAVVRAECTADVQAALRWASAHGVSWSPARRRHRPVRRRRAASDGGIVVSTERMRAIEIDPLDPHGRRAARAAQRRGQGGRGRGRPLVPAGPVVASRSAPSAATSPPTPAACAA